MAEKSHLRHRRTGRRTPAHRSWCPSTSVRQPGSTPSPVIEQANLGSAEGPSRALLPSWVWYQDMADFADRISDQRAGRSLLRAIQGKGAFRRFKDRLHGSYPHPLPAPGRWIRRAAGPPGPTRTPADRRSCGQDRLTSLNATVPDSLHRARSRGQSCPPVSADACRARRNATAPSMTCGGPLWTTAPRTTVDSTPRDVPVRAAAGVAAINRRGPRCRTDQRPAPRPSSVCGAGRRSGFVLGASGAGTRAVPCQWVSCAGRASPGPCGPGPCAPGRSWRPASARWWSWARGG